MKYSKIKFTLIGLLISTLIASAQVEPSSTNSIKSNMVSFGLEGAMQFPLGISYGQMLNNRVSFEMGIGILAVGAEVNIYLTDPTKHRLNFYTGVSGAINFDGEPMVYVPVGLSFFGKNNFEYSADIGVLGATNVSSLEGDSNFSPWFGLKVGYRFGEDVTQLKEREKTNKKNIISLTTDLNNLLVGIIYERLLTPYLGLEAGFGFLGATVGTKFYFQGLSTEKVNFHVGVSQTWGYFTDNTYFPIGIHRLTKNNFLLSFDIGPAYDFYSDESLTFSYSLKIGKAF